MSCTAWPSFFTQVIAGWGRPSAAQGIAVPLELEKSAFVGGSRVKRGPLVCRSIAQPVRIIKRAII